jgi:hypothetical protein
MPPYRLQVLLDIRTQAEEEAKEAFSAAVKAHEKEKQTLVRLQKDLETRKIERKAKVQAFLAQMTQGGGGVGGFQQMHRFEQRLKDEETQVGFEIDRQAGVVKEAEQLVETRRLEMAEAAKERKAIEKHKETWAKQVRQERMQKEELNQEEIGNSLHLQRMRAEKKS